MKPKQDLNQQVVTKKAPTRFLNGAEELLDCLATGNPRSRLGWLAGLDGTEVGPDLNGDPLWFIGQRPPRVTEVGPLESAILGAEKYLDLRLLKLGTLWVSSPNAYFNWTKLGHCACHLIVVQILFHLFRWSKFGFPSRESIGSQYRYGAAEVILAPQGVVTVSGGRLLREPYTLILKSEWPSSGLGPAWKLAWNSSLEAQFHEQLPTLGAISIANWLNGTSFNEPAFSSFAHFASAGLLEVRGRARDALADQTVIDPDVFAISQIRFDPDGSSIWVGDTRLWNAEVRISPDLKPSYLELEELAEAKMIQSNNRALTPSDTRELIEWASKVLEVKKQPPSEKDCIDWGKARRLSRESIRILRKSLPHNLRRYRGETNK